MAISVPFAVIARYHWRMISYRCERCPSASRRDNTAGLCTYKMYLRATVRIRVLPRLRTGGLSSWMVASTWWAGSFRCMLAHGKAGLCCRAGLAGAAQTDRVISSLIKLCSLSQRTFTLRYFGFSVKFCLRSSIYATIVLPCIMLAIRRSTAKQKGKHCLSRLSLFCLLPFRSLHTFAGKVFPLQCISQ